MQLKGKNVLITGGSAGLVCPLFQRLTSRALNVLANSLLKVNRPRKFLTLLGCNIAINYANSTARAEAFGTDLQAKFPALTIAVIQADVGVKSACEALISETIAALGGLDIIISNAGITCAVMSRRWLIRRLDTILSVRGLGVPGGGVG